MVTHSSPINKLVLARLHLNDAIKALASLGVCEVAVDVRRHINEAQYDIDSAGKEIAEQEARF